MNIRFTVLCAELPVAGVWGMRLRLSANYAILNL
jgi:hypothetical protein